VPARSAMRRWAWTLGALLLAAALAMSWRAWFAAPATSAPSTAPVPEHQRTGPLANPWGNAPPANASRAEELAAAAAASAAAASAASAASSAPAPSASLAPPTREAVRAALARLRAGATTGAFVGSALKSREPAALVAAWMAERQCRQWLHGQQMMEWRARAGPGRGGPGGAAPGASAMALPPCEVLPESGLVDEALAAAGFVVAAEGPAELTRRPADFAFAVAVGDPALLAEVLDASDGERVAQQLQAWGADARDLAAPEVVRAAAWLASCTPLDATGRASTAATLLPACRDHPVLWQACLHHGLCDARDLRDLYLRTMQADTLGTIERLARWLAPRIGR